MYIILNNVLNRIGILENGRPGTTPYYNDVITKQLADDNSSFDLSSVKDTLNNGDPNANTKNWGHTLDSIYVPYGYPDTNKIIQGNHLAYRDPDNKRWYVMRLTNVTDAVDQSGSHYKQASGINLCIWKLGKTVHFAKEIKNANSRTAFMNILSDTGWYIDPNSEIVGGSMDISFDGTSSNQNYLQQFCQNYGAEVDAYVQFDQGWSIALKRVEVKRHIGEDSGKRVEYKKDLTEISRSVVDDSLYTKLYVYGADGTSCAFSGNGNKPFVKDDVANNIYNPPLNDTSTTYLEGAISSGSMKNPAALYDWGMKQLKIFNHPRANYTINIDRNYVANLGDTIRVLDLEMQPELTVLSRVIKKQYSLSDPTQTQITLGEFTTVNVVAPSFIRSMNNRIGNHMSELLSQIRDNPNALTCTVDKPDGVSWEENQTKKTFIAHVSILGEDISPVIQPQGFVWELYRDGTPDEQFKKEHEMSGQYLSIDPSIVGEIRLSIDTSYIVNTPEVNFDENNIQHVFSVQGNVDQWGDKRTRAIQYVNWSKQDNCYYASYVYSGRNRPRKANGRLSQPEGHTMISRLRNDGSIIDSMIMLYSRHNSNFGLQSYGGQTYLWTTYYDVSYDNKNNARRYWVARVPYQPGKIINPNDSSIQKGLPYSNSFVMANYDESSDRVVVNYDDSPQMKVEIYQAQDILDKHENAVPVKTFNRLDYGFYPKTTSDDIDTNKQTFQSCCLKYPYFFFTTGNVNMSDERYVYCINLNTNTLVFKKDLTFEGFGLDDYDFVEPETLSWTTDSNNNPLFLYGLNFANDASNHKHASGLWKIGFDTRVNKTINAGDMDINDDDKDSDKQ